METVLATVVVAVFLGISAQVLAHRFKLPAILPLLLFGMAAGPFGLGFFDPKALGAGLEVIVHLGVAVILFEGGLSLDLRQLRQVGAAVRNLLFFGTIVTALGGAALARYLLDISWSTAALFGAIVTVTGPTVIVPLLRHMIAPRKVRTILLSEGLMIDPIGAVLAYLVLQWIDRAGMGFKPLLTEILVLSVTGAVIGFVAGSIAAFVVRYRHLADELRNLVILAVLLGSFLAAEHQAPQSGILATVVMGLTLSAAHLPDLSPLKAFKGQLTVLIISVLFILLSGQLDLDAVYRLGLPGLLVVGGLILLVRPLSVLVSIPPSQMDWRGKAVLALTAPRGIVAAAVASLSAIQLRAVGAGDDASVLEGLVYLVILVTCTWATLMAPLLPKWLGYLDDPSRRRVVLVGSHPLSVALAEVLGSRGWTAVIVDTVAAKLAGLRECGIVPVRGDARDAATYEAAGVERDTQVLAMTPNDALNLLIAELAREEFGVEHPVVVLKNPSSEFGQVRRAWIDLLGGRGLDFSNWSRRLADGAAEMITVEPEPEPQDLRELGALIAKEPDVCFFVCGWKGDRPSFECTPEDLEKFDQVTLLVLDGAREELAAITRVPGSAPEEGGDLSALPSEAEGGVSGDG